MSQRPDITVIAAACNEAEQAEEWLEHLRWVGRVVVVDTGSEDSTVDLLVRGGADVLPLEVTCDALIHGAKNQAIGQVADGWILDLDLDERVPFPLQQEIEATLDRHRDTDSGPVAFRVPFQHYIFGRWVRFGGWSTRHIRLYRAGHVHYPETRAHSTPQVDGAVADLEERILHFAHPTLHDFLVKMNRYTSHDAPLILEHGKGGLRDRPALPPRPFRWLRASGSVFWNRYVKGAGFRDGVPGFLVASLMASYAFVEQAKVWELEHGLRRDAPSSGSG